MKTRATTKTILLINDLANIEMYGQAIPLIAKAEHAHALRDQSAIRKAGASLLSIGSDCETIGLYYYALSLIRIGDHTQAEILLSQVISFGSDLFKRKSLITFGGNRYDNHNYSASSEAFKEAGRIKTTDLASELRRSKMLAVLKSREGDHQGALTDLEKLQPLAKEVCSQHPVLYYDHLNSLAVELGELGRIEEARNICQVALASPFAIAYPEWRETGKELELRAYKPSRSKVFLKKSLPLRASNVFYLEDWKMAKQAQENTQPPERPATREEMQKQIMDYTLDRKVSNEDLAELLEYIEAKREK